MAYRPCAHVHPAARSVIQRKLRTLCPRPRWAAPGDRQDVAQELALHAHRITPQHDPKRGSPLVFFERAMTNFLRDLRAKANAGRRDWRRTVAFEQPDELPGPFRRNIELQVDVRRALSAAPEPLRRLAVELTRDSLVGAARRLGLSRQQARHQRQLLADHFVRCGLGPPATNDQRRAAA